MLKSLLILVLATTVFADDCCNNFDGRSYSRTAILKIRGRPQNLVYNPNTHDLFFDLVDADSLGNEEVYPYVLRDGEPIKINNGKGLSAAVDVQKNKVYLATEDGLNILNSTKKSHYYRFSGENIALLHKPVHTDDLYMITSPGNHVYLVNLQTNEKNKIENIPCANILAVDDQDNIYYQCNSKYIKVLLKDFQEPLKFAGIGKDAASDLAFDGNKRMILATDDGLYHLRPDNLIPKKLMNLDYSPAGITFDGDDLYLSTNGIIYKYEYQG